MLFNDTINPLTGKEFEPLPSEIDRRAIIKIDAKGLANWAKRYGWVALNRRLHEGLYKQ